VAEISILNHSEGMWCPYCKNIYFRVNNFDMEFSIGGEFCSIYPSKIIICECLFCGEYWWNHLTSDGFQEDTFQVGDIVEVER